MTDEKFSLAIASYRNWHQEVGLHGHSHDWPEELTGVVRGLISATLNRRIAPDITPAASDDLIGLARIHLADGFKIAEDAYAVGVFIPFSGEAEKLGKRFVLLPKYPGGVVRRLDEL